MLHGQGEREDDVLSVLRRLKPKDREIVMLSAWEDLPRDTIAEMMGTTRAAIDQRIHRSHQRLAQLLAPALEQAPMAPPITKAGGT